MATHHLPQGIREHPWFNSPLTPKLQAALDDMQEEQRTRDRLARAAVRGASMGLN